MGLYYLILKDRVSTALRKLRLIRRRIREALR